ncbi:MAG: hypothetical protein COB02_15015 [Candidatus Cloacimonadota bacterium]|nr:MAG: hypothetical protein COB02_15015 [Candidatus Cloacimonadota bacterium]
MKAIEFKDFKIDEIENNKILISTTFKIQDDNDDLVKNSILITKILENKEVELKTNDKGFTSLSFYKNKEDCQTKVQIDLLQFYTQQSINSHLIFKEKLLEDKELLYFPLGDYDFQTLREDNKLYIDKTSYIYKLLQTSKACFISRPRRFGKSLVISTLENLFNGKKELFKNLDIEKTDYSFEEYPVIRLDLSSHRISNKKECKELIHQLLQRSAEKYGYLKAINNYASFFEDFSKFTNKKIVLLVDEYDKPVLDNIIKKETLNIVSELGSFFGATKSASKYIKFLFITGITKLSNINMFSDANHITDLGRYSSFDAMFGYTQEELENIFQPYIINLAKQKNTTYHETLENIKKYYNGYTFSEEGRSIYNPFSILQLFASNSFDNYWFDSGTPTFVLELMKEKEFDISDKTLLEYSEDLFDKARASQLTIKNILFQAGYLTIKINENNEKELVFPNTEVRDSFYKYFIRFFSKIGINYSVHIKNIKKAFINKDWIEVKEILNDYFDEFTYETTGSEKLYHSLTFALFKLTGFKVYSEVLTKKGRIDQYLENGNDIYIIEYKYKKSPQKAMKQIIDQKYFQKYMKTDKNIYLIAINFEKDGEIKDDILVINPRDQKALETFLTRK